MVARGDGRRRGDHTALLPFLSDGSRKRRGWLARRCLPPLADRVPDEAGRPVGAGWAAPVGFEGPRLLLGDPPPAVAGGPLLRDRFDRHRDRAPSHDRVFAAGSGLDLRSLPPLLEPAGSDRCRGFCRCGADQRVRGFDRLSRADRSRSLSARNLAFSEARLLGRPQLRPGGHGSRRSLDLLLGTAHRQPRLPACARPPGADDPGLGGFS